jgi:hypothetical protein
MLVADLRTRQLTTSIDLTAPREGRQPTRVKWLIRQLPEADARLRLSSSFVNTRETASALLGEVRNQPQRLLNSSEPRREIRAFEIALTRGMGLKNGRGAGSFIEETRSQLHDFYGQVVQNLTSWQPRAPRLPEAEQEVDLMQSVSSLDQGSVPTTDDRPAEIATEAVEPLRDSLGASPLSLGVGPLREQPPSEPESSVGTPEVP